MIDYVLGIDAGGTKTKARLQSIATGEHWQLRAGPASLTNDRSGAIHCVIQVIVELLEQAGINSEQVSLVCGIAGANHLVASEQLQKRVAELELGVYQVTTDAITSVYGAGVGKPLLCAAVGTGSVAITLDEHGETQQYGGWGFTAGDQGSGADLGRKLVRTALEQYDAGMHFNDELYRALFDEIGQSPEQIMSWLNAAKPADYARLMHTMQRFPEHPRVVSLLNYAGQSISRLIDSAHRDKSMPVALIGGMAPYILPFIDDHIKTSLQDSKGDALDGALVLARRQINNIN